MRTVLAVVALALAVLAAPLVFKPGGPGGIATTETPPWEIVTTDEGHSRVFGLTLGESTLGDAMQALGQDIEIAIITAPGERGALEAYYGSIISGPVTGKLVLTAQIDEATLEAMIARATKTEFMESTTRKSALHPDDLARALTMKVRAVGFIPSINLDEQTIVTRFGEPAERVRGSDGVEHLLYPAKGLDIILSTTGKELMQYVAPVNFETLRTPLDAAASAPPVAPGS
ncbi:MAG: hypothetical protein H6948_11485 [Zoogloeaceae bacterium]|nr:hypothetical protein [Zoogloeaceae bacterium]